MKESGPRGEPFSQSRRVGNKESGLHGRLLFHVSKWLITPTDFFLKMIFSFL